MTRFVLASLLCGLAFAASAQDPAATTKPGAVERSAQAEDKAFDDRNCLRETGTRIATRIKPKQDKQDRKGCVAGTGRSYTGEDLRRTGYHDLSDALRSLDPAVN